MQRFTLTVELPDEYGDSMYGVVGVLRQAADVIGHRYEPEGRLTTQIPFSDMESPALEGTYKLEIDRVGGR